MDSLGGLIDRLTIVNLKIWHLQDWVHSVGDMTPKAFSQSYPQAKIELLGNLNKERNQIMTQIDHMVGTEFVVRDKV